MAQNLEDKDKSLFYYDQDKAILYGVAVGETQDLKYLYECDGNFSIVPSFAILPGLEALIESDVYGTALADRNIPYDPTRLLHGEQYIELFQPIPSNTYGEPLVTSKKARLLDVLDKGNSTVVITEVDTFSYSGELLFRNQICSVIMGSGNWGGPRQSSDPRIKEIVKTPSDIRPPDKVICQTTNEHQAVMYRLIGDKNPLHVDPTFAQGAGFTRPILHGLCTLGFATRHVIQAYSPDCPQNCLRVKVRFSGIIYPGQTIQTEMWKEGNRIHFECKVQETGKAIISGGYMDLKHTIGE